MTRSPSVAVRASLAPSRRKPTGCRAQPGTGETDGNQARKPAVGARHAAPLQNVNVQPSDFIRWRTVTQP
ncbi:MAG: hypothetical protein IT330_09740 [Anaerolineae bacterium]|nr:hypothetical protein [Anaerolineae bacterium]